MENNNKSISVAMAAYNGSKFIREQLDSILVQLEPQDEIVVSYDVSTDDTLEILKRYQAQDSRVRIVFNDHPGICGNFNNAISACKGDYIFICDQDDRWAEHKRQSVVDTFSKTQADTVIHNGVHIDAEGKIISEPFFSTYRIGDGKIRNILKSRYSGCCMAFTQKMAKVIMPMPIDIDAYDRWIGVVSEFFGKIAYDDRVLLYHRLHGGNVTPTHSRSLGIVLSTRIQLVRELRRRIRRERKR